MKTLENPFFSIVIATFNSESTLEHCLSSIFDQTSADFEVIVIDGASQDQTLAIIKRYKRIRIVSEPDEGIYDAWNKALRLVRGEWIYFLGSDDFLYDKSTLQAIAPILGQIPENIKVVYGRTQIVNSKGERVTNAGQPWPSIKNKFMQMMCIPHQGVFHRSSLFEKGRCFDKVFRSAGDYELLLRELCQHDAFFFETPTVACMRLGGVSTNKSHKMQALHEMRRAQKKNGVRGIPLQLYWTMLKTKLFYLLEHFLGQRVSCLFADCYRILSGRPAIWLKKQ